MDRMLYISMSGAKQTMLAQTVNSNNLANVSTHGFREDFFQQRSQPVFGDGYASRVYAMTENPAFKSQAGMLDTTGRQLDVAINGDGWFAVQADPQTGEEALTRAGNFKVDGAGFLVTPDGHQVLGDGGPINLPPFEQIEIGTDGTLSILPVGQDAAALAVVDRIRLVNPPIEDLFKGKDGLIHLKNGAGADVDPGVRIVSGALESSNVSAVESLVQMIDLSRRYEMQVKMMKTADRAAEVTTQMMRL